MQQIKKLFYRNGKSYFSYVMIPVLFLVLIPLNMVASSAYDSDARQQEVTAPVAAVLQEVTP